MNLHSVLKRNPYHDQRGRFTFAHNANFVSLWARDLKTFPKQEVREYLDTPLPTGDELAQARDLFGQVKNSLPRAKPSILTVEQIMAAERYAGGSSGFNDPAKLMAAGTPIEQIPYASDARKIPDLNAAINQSPLPQDRVLWRGLRASGSGYSKVAADLLRRAQAGESLIGSVITTPAFMSTSIDKGQASKFSDSSSNPVMIRINAKKGQKALFMGTISSFGFEAEMLLPTNTKLLVRKADLSKISQFSSRLQIEADLV